MCLIFSAFLLYLDGIKPNSNAWCKSGTKTPGPGTRDQAPSLKVGSETTPKV